MLKNQKLGTKLMIIFILVAILTGGTIGAIGYFNLNRITGVVNEITDQRIPAVKNATSVERYALRTIMDEKNYLLAASDATKDESEAQQSAMANIEQIYVALDEVDKIAKQFDDADLAAKSKDARIATQEYHDLYNQAADKIKERSTAEATMRNNAQLVTQLAQEYFEIKLKETDDENYQQALAVVVEIWATALDTRQREKNYIIYKDPAEYETLQSNLAKLDVLYDDLEKYTRRQENIERIAKARTATLEYKAAAETWVKLDDETSALLNEMNTLGLSVQEKALTAEDAGWEAAEAIKQEADDITSQGALITMGAIILAIASGVVIGIIVPRNIVKPIRIVENAAQAIAEGDLDQTVEIDSRDEIGSMAISFQKMIEYMRGMAEVAGAVAQGNLTIAVQPKSSKDVLGNAFHKMIVSLNESVGAVADNACQLASASHQLALASDQAGSASSQIATTIQQVAKGTADQTESVTSTATSMDQMTRVIDGVARGAQEQAKAVGKASDVTTQINNAVLLVAGNAQAVTRDSADAAEAARKGSSVVAQTVQGMQSIKEKVGYSAQKVQEMGDRSQQIGMIVETIEDIASQTNLLALNAAIEAARAGEHGKGFAVVADEVRKLAERSSNATKEIGALIKGIQTTVSEAVDAMKVGENEVEKGVASAREAGQSLDDILKAAEAVFTQANQAAEATGEIGVMMSDLVNAVDSVSAVVEENTAATEEMAAGSNEVSRAVESIASVSEENSASVEEVSASVEEMSAQVEEVNASAQSLSEMAVALQKICSQFMLAKNVSEFGSTTDNTDNNHNGNHHGNGAQALNAKPMPEMQQVKSIH